VYEWAGEPRTVVKGSGPPSVSEQASFRRNELRIGEDALCFERSGICQVK